MHIGQRVTVNNSTNSMYSGQKGTITGFNHRHFNVDVELDEGQHPEGGNLPFHTNELDVAPVKQFVLVLGDVITGLELVGPFDSADKAHLWAQHSDMPYVISPMIDKSEEY